MTMANILLIDDDLQVRELLTIMLTHYKHSVVTAENGEEALKVFKSRRPDLIITDILMPKKDGIETILELLELDKSIPIVAISGGRGAMLSSDFNLDSAKMIGANAILKKPFSHAQLQEAIKEAMDTPRFNPKSAGNFLT
jgi:CheY-like chemotaxis protein